MKFAFLPNIPWKHASGEDGGKGRRGKNVLVREHPEVWKQFEEFHLGCFAPTLSNFGLQKQHSVLGDAEKRKRLTLEQDEAREWKELRDRMKGIQELMEECLSDILIEEMQEDPDDETRENEDERLSSMQVELQEDQDEELSTGRMVI